MCSAGKGGVRGGGGIKADRRAMKGRSNKNRTFSMSRARNRRRAARGGRGARATQVLLRWIKPCGRADAGREAEVSRAVYGRAVLGSEGGWAMVNRWALVSWAKQE